MPKYEIEGSPIDGYRIWMIDEAGDVHEQASPPFHDPRDALKWAQANAIPAEIINLAKSCDHDWVHHHDMLGPINDLCVKCGATKESDES